MITKSPNTIKWFSLASIIFLSVSFVIYFQNAKYTKNVELLKEQESALKLYNETKSALDTISLEINKAEKSITILYEYNNLKDKIFKH